MEYLAGKTIALVLYVSLTISYEVHNVGDHGVGPCASFLSGKRSTAELITRKEQLYQIWRRVPELNRRMGVLQTPALPLRQRAIT